MWLVTAGVVLVMVSLGALPAARADEAEQRRMAGQLYAAAQSAVKGGDYLSAAALFEQANATLPTPQALRATVQMYVAADQPRIALTRAEELLRRYPYDPTSRSLALQIIDQHAGRFVRVLVTCDAECVVQTDEARQAGEPGRSHIAYLTDGRHDISARFDDGSTITKHIRRNAGQAVSLAFERGLSPVQDPDQPSAPGTARPAASPASDGASTADRDDMRTPAPMRLAEPTIDRFALPPRLPLLVGGVLTAGLGVASVLSHRDALALEQGAGDASDAQQRTRLLVGATALSAVTTLAVSIIWARRAGDADARAQRDGAGLAVAADSHGYWVGMRGRF